MSLDRRGHLCRTRRVNGKFVCEYVGSGPEATMLARAEAAVRDKRRLAHATEKQRATDIVQLSRYDRALDEWMRHILEAAMFAAGYRQHNRGQWRKTRVRT